MRRFFGGSAKPQQPTPTLAEASASVDKRCEALDERIKKLDAELIRYRQQMQRTRPGPAQNGIKQRALKVMKQKKMYEQQRDQLMGQSFNMEQAQMMTQTLQDTVTIVQTMKDAKVAMQKQFKDVKIGDIENLWDDMEDLYETSNEVQDILSRSYGVPEEFDEADLEEELAALGEEDWGQEEASPSYLQAVTSPMGGESALPAPPMGVGPGASDPYGLPSVPQGELANW
jgi:charged multivesicular body protein 5